MPLLLLLATAGCKVYDADLLQTASATRGQAIAPDASMGPMPAWFTREETPANVATGAVSGGGAADGAEDDDDDDDDAGVPLPELCGNGVVDEFEHCDIAIAQGQPGACPTGCNGRKGCSERVLRGHDCSARCESVLIEATLPADGCCPAGATPATDSDCVATCGNGVVEPGEQCDPVESCPQRDTCTTNDVCMTAHYSGEREQCTASCELVPIYACMSDDGCCPDGCFSPEDNDCPPRQGPAPCDGCDAQPSSDGPTQDSCQSWHSGGDCAACDCSACPAETKACVGMGSPDRIAACKAVADCAAENHCRGIDCLCGPFGLDRCAQRPLGPCAPEVIAASGTNNILAIALQTGLDDTPIGAALALLDCRSRNCEQQCGL